MHPLDVNKRPLADLIVALDEAEDPDARFEEIWQSHWQVLPEDVIYYYWMIGGSAKSILAHTQQQRQKEGCVNPAVGA